MTLLRGRGARVLRGARAGQARGVVAAAPGGRQGRRGGGQGRDTRPSQISSVPQMAVSIIETWTVESPYCTIAWQI